MANFNYRLATKSESDGKKQIMVRVDLTKDVRPSFKTGVYVNPELFTEGKGDFKKPKAKKFGNQEMEEAIQAEAQLRDYAATLNKIILQSKSHVKAKEMKKWILDVLALKNLSTIYPFTYDNILAAMEAQKAAEQAAKIGTIYDYIIEYCATAHRYGKGVIKKPSENRVKSFYSLGRTLARYEYFKQHTGNPSFSLYVPDITHKTIEDFLQFYKTEGDLSKKHPAIFSVIREKTRDVMKDNVKDECAKRPTNRSASSIMLFYSILTTLFDWIVIKQQIIRENPCRDAMIETQKEYEKEILYLTIKQRDRLANAEIKGKRRQITRDIFVFACHTGCRISDLQNLTEKNIKKEKDKNTGVIYNVLEYEPVKTSHGRKHNFAYVPLSSKAMEIVEKYKDSTRDGKLFPCTTTTKYDTLIKKVFEDAGLTEPVEVVNPKTGELVTRPLNELATSHLARKTFTVNYNFATGGNVSMVRKAAGHSATSKVTETTYISNTIGMQYEAINRMNAMTSEEEA